MIMKSILDGRPLLKEEVDKIAEVAGYLWQKGRCDKGIACYQRGKGDWSDAASFEGAVFLLQRNKQANALPCSLADGEWKCHSSA